MSGNKHIKKPIKIGKANSGQHKEANGKIAKLAYGTGSMEASAESYVAHFVRDFYKKHGGIMTRLAYE